MLIVKREVYSTLYLRVKDPSVEPSRKTSSVMVGLYLSPIRRTPCSVEKQECLYLPGSRVVLVRTKLPVSESRRQEEAVSEV